MEDSKIVELYWCRDQQAIQETAGKYGSFLARISQNILRSSRDAEECVNDTYLRAWNSIPPTRPKALQSWLGCIIRNLSLDRWKQRQTDKRGGGPEVLLGELADCVPTFQDPESVLEDQDLAQALSKFLKKLSHENRLIFLQRYWYGESIASIAAGLGCREGKVKSALFRSRKALRVYLEKEEISL